MIKLLTPAILLFIFPVLMSQEKTVKNEKFAVDAGGLSVSISSENLGFTSSIVRPSTFPVTSEPANWKILNKTSVTGKIGGINGQIRSTTFQTNTGEIENETWISDNKDLVAFRQTYTNKTKKPVKLNNLFPLFIDGKQAFSFGNISDWRILEQFRHKNDLPKSEIPIAGKSVVCDPFFIINNNKGSGKNLFIGYQTFYLHLADITLSFDNDLRLKNISANCDFEGVELPPDGSKASQWVIISQGSDANLMIDEYTARIRTFYNAEQPSKNSPSVYCTWYYHADTYNEEIFKRDIAQFRKEHLPFDVFLIDECWDVNDWGDFEANKSFPDGMRWVAGQISSIGYTPGIWTAPFLVDGESSLAQNHSAWLLKNSKGQMCTFNMNGRDHFILDLTYPGVCAYLEDQFRKISQDWGYGYFKFDFMRSVFLESDQQFYNKSTTSLEAYRMGLEAIRRGTGKDAYISVCGGHYGASFGIANTQRSGSDVKSQWNETELPKYRQNVLRTWMSGLWHVDPDAMMVRRQNTPIPSDKRNLTTGLFTDEEAFTNTVNQFIGGNLITFTEDFAKIDEDRKTLYKYIIPSVNSSSRPLDLFNTVCPEKILTPIIPKCSKLGKWNMLSIVNWSNNSKGYNVPVDNHLTGNLDGEHFLFFDFRSQRIIGWFAKGDTLKIKDIQPHQTSLLKVVPWDGKSPMFVGTDLNYSCGGLEISELDYNTGNVSGVIQTGWNLPVKLSFVVPTPEGFNLEQTVLTSGQKRFHIVF